MLRLLAVAGLAFFVTSCADLNRANNTGGSGGMDGTGGSGGVGGMAGSGGMGGMGGMRDPCADADTRCDDSNECTFDDCDTSSGMCLHVNRPNGTQCEVDGEADTCSSGVCRLSAAASAFCQDYEETCGFGGTDRYISESDCYQTYDGASAEKQDCIEQHLGFATAGDPTTHCPHAAGEPPCDLSGGVGGMAGSGGMGGIAGAGGGMPPILSTCAAILADDPNATSRVYTIDPDQSGSNPPVDTYCDMTTDSGGWTQLYDQDVTVLGGYLPTTTWAAGVTNTAPNGGQFSILQLTSHFGQGGWYEFLIDWEDRTNFVQWEQSVSPLVGRGTVRRIVQFPTNQLGCPDFGGLGADMDGSSLLDGSDPDFDFQDTCWWWAIGTSEASANGIPTYRIAPNTQLSATRTRLWVR